MRLLSGTERGVPFDWHRVVAGSDSSVRLAQDLLVDPDQHLGLDTAFRPAILQL